ncbi:MAG: hypothetical protein FD180_1936 [Planctomycetota bacterium]|nr:MAG: hypothetical protein FD180_1936 [Planctomycetota bacterium]
MGAVPAKLAFPSALGILFYSVMPAVGIGAGVAFFLLRNKSDRDLSLQCKESLSDLPDPEKSKEVI